jgi:hypothetical protein
MQVIVGWAQIIVVLRCSVVAANRSPLTTTVLAQSSAFECGKPGAPCGKAVPADANCQKGPGFCQAGHYCGYRWTSGGSRSDIPRCLPLPKDCGTSGNECCPSNKDSPHLSIEDKLKRQPTCTDGSHCFYYLGESDSDESNDPYAAIKGERVGRGLSCGLDSRCRGGRSQLNTGISNFAVASISSTQ